MSGRSVQGPCGQSWGRLGASWLLPGCSFPSTVASDLPQANSYLKAPISVKHWVDVTVPTTIFFPLAAAWLWGRCPPRWPRKNRLKRHRAPSPPCLRVWLTTAAAAHIREG